LIGFSAVVVMPIWAKIRRGFVGVWQKNRGIFQKIGVSLIDNDAK
jgi:hypothetical protein